MLISTSFILMQYTTVPFKMLLQSNSMSTQACGSLALQVLKAAGAVVLFLAI